MLQHNISNVQCVQPNQISSAKTSVRVSEAASEFAGADGK
jgi:hypothetical protein